MYHEFTDETQFLNSTLTKWLFPCITSVMSEIDGTAVVLLSPIKSYLIEQCTSLHIDVQYSSGNSLHHLSAVSFFIDIEGIRFMDSLPVADCLIDCEKTEVFRFFGELY